MSPRAVFGMPAYNRPDTLARTLESLLSQTFSDFAVVIVDDCPSPEVAGIIDEYAAIDPRITYEANKVRLGMIGNWRKAFERSRELHPAMDYFAWASDHDIWHPRWLERLVPVLEEHPDVVMAYPRAARLVAGEWRRVEGSFETRGIGRPEERLRVAIEDMTAGNCIYGLFRASALAQAGVFRPVMLPDRQVLLQLAVLGEFSNVPEFLWYREVNREFTFQRQRQAFFPDRIPLYTYGPASVQHFAVLFWDLFIRGQGRPSCDRLVGLRLACLQLWYSVRRGVRRGYKAWRATLEQTSVGRRFLRAATAPDRAEEAKAAAAQVEPLA